jgi:hypothetical protein
VIGAKVPTAYCEEVKELKRKLQEFRHETLRKQQERFKKAQYVFALRIKRTIPEEDIITVHYVKKAVEHDSRYFNSDWEIKLTGEIDFALLLLPEQIVPLSKRLPFSTEIIWKEYLGIWCPECKSPTHSEANGTGNLITQCNWCEWNQERV